jgi:hypothetical protein
VEIAHPGGRSNTPPKEKKTFQFFVCLVLQDGTKEFVLKKNTERKRDT